MDIRDWVARTFWTSEPKVFLELGAHKGEDTFWLAAIPGVTLHAFEPNLLCIPPQMPNVTVHRLAVAAHDGHCEFTLSKKRGGRPYTKSSSIRRPKNHLTMVPDVTFGETIQVPCCTLDTFVEAYRIDEISLIWADIQGAEGDMIAGGLKEALPRTRYLYTEWSDAEEYEGQITLAQILALLPDWQIMHRWEHDVLLVNRARLPS